jgi:hypothetical protein
VDSDEVRNVRATHPEPISNVGRGVVAWGSR